MVKINKEEITNEELIERMKKIRQAFDEQEHVNIGEKQINSLGQLRDEIFGLLYHKDGIRGILCDIPEDDKTTILEIFKNKPKVKGNKPVTIKYTNEKTKDYSIEHTKANDFIKDLEGMYDHVFWIRICRNKRKKNMWV